MQPGSGGGLTMARRYTPRPAGLRGSRTPHELRTTFVSLLSHRGVSIEEIARLRVVP